MNNYPVGIGLVEMILISLFGRNWEVMSCLSFFLGGNLGCECWSFFSLVEIETSCATMNMGGHDLLFFINYIPKIIDNNSNIINIILILILILLIVLFQSPNEKEWISNLKLCFIWFNLWIMEISKFSLAKY